VAEGQQPVSPRTTAAQKFTRKERVQLYERKGTTFVKKGKKVKPTKLNKE
jgi:hypothetical protein